jgi:hypothetical protein
MGDDDSDKLPVVEVVVDGKKSKTDSTLPRMKINAADSTDQT